MTRITHYCSSGAVGQLEAEWDADSEEYRSLGKCRTVSLTCTGTRRALNMPNPEHTASGKFVCTVCGTTRQTPLGISRHRAMCNNES